MPPHRPYRIGSLVAGALTGDPPNAASVYTETRNYTVVVPGMPDLVVTLARKAPTGTERGTVVLFSGESGTAWYSAGAGPTETWIDSLMAEGWRIFQVKWQTGWNDSTLDGRHGPVVLAGRTATVVRWVRDNHVVVANLWLVGNSGGADQAAYVMSHYGMHSVVQGVVMGGGPPRGHILGGCRSDAGLSYSASARIEIDDSYDINAAQGACELGSVAVQGSACDYDSIRRGHLGWGAKATYLWGAADTTEAPAHGAVLADLQPASLRGRPFGAPHAIQTDAAGRQAVADAINDRPLVRQTTGIGNLTGTLITRTFDKAVAAGSLLVAVHRAVTTAANVTTPTGWTIARQVAFASAAVMTTFSRVADGSETGLTVATATSVGASLDVYEVTHRATSTWTLDQTDDTPAVASILTVTAGPTAATTAAKEWCLAVAGWSTSTPGTLNNDWTNGFVQLASSAAGRLATAAKSLDATGTPSSAMTWTTATSAAAMLCTWRPT